MDDLSAENDSLRVGELSYPRGRSLFPGALSCGVLAMRMCTAALRLA